MGKKSGSGFGIRIRDEQPESYHISESLDTIFLVKIFKFFDLDAGTGIRDGKNSDPGSGINIPDPQHCWSCSVLYVV
jgi:hypothetical protein